MLEWGGGGGGESGEGLKHTNQKCFPYSSWTLVCSQVVPFDVVLFFCQDVCNNIVSNWATLCCKELCFPTTSTGVRNCKARMAWF